MTGPAMRTLRMAGSSASVALLLNRVRHSGEHGLDVVAFQIVHESGVIGRSVVRQPMHGELTETTVAGAA